MKFDSNINSDGIETWHKRIYDIEDKIPREYIIKMVMYLLKAMLQEFSQVTTNGVVAYELLPPEVFDKMELAYFLADPYKIEDHRIDWSKNLPIYIFRNDSNDITSVSSIVMITDTSKTISLDCFRIPVGT